MVDLDDCPVCKGAYGSTSTVEKYDHSRMASVNCLACGHYLIDASSIHLLEKENGFWTIGRRAALSHKLVLKIDVPLDKEGEDLPILRRERTEIFEKDGISCPSALEQCRNILRLISRAETVEGAALVQFPTIAYAVVGCPSPKTVLQRAKDMTERGWITCNINKSVFEPSGHDPLFEHASLTLAGWEEVEAINRGDRDSHRGVIAMSFGDEDVARFVEEVVKPAVASLGDFKVHRIDDIEIVQAGVIDNLMRDRIQESSFLLADLTNENKGAYWEAGFAEGLGKPVIYLCEKSKWDEFGTHFDTNHCTTIVWNRDDDESSKNAIAATIRNSLSK